jgi:transcription elongation factor Elf1
VLQWEAPAVAQAGHAKRRGALAEYTWMPTAKELEVRLEGMRRKMISFNQDGKNKSALFRRRQQRNSKVTPNKRPKYFGCVIKNSENKSIKNVDKGKCIENRHDCRKSFLLCGKHHTIEEHYESKHTESMEITRPVDLAYLSLFILVVCSQAA